MLRMTSDKINGISDYCDHWCERCAFTTRCDDFDKSVDPQIKEIADNPALLSRIRQNFEKAMEKIEGSGQSRTGDVHTLLAKEKQKKKLFAENPLLELSANYSEMTSQWLKTQPGMLDRLERLKEELTMGFASVDIGKSTAELIRNALDTIHWDCSLIHSKLIEALSLKIKEQSDFVVASDARSEGLGKVVLLSIDRSMNAWRLIFELLPEREDDFLGILACLQKLQRLVGEAFPTAMQFRRPGFDD